MPFAHTSGVLRPGLSYPKHTPLFVIIHRQGAGWLGWLADCCWVRLGGGGVGLDWVRDFPITSQHVASGSPDFDLGPMRDWDWLIWHFPILCSHPRRWVIPERTPSHIPRLTPSLSADEVV